MVSSITKLRGSVNEVTLNPLGPAVAIGGMASLDETQQSKLSNNQAGFAAIRQEAVALAQAGAGIIEVRADRLAGDETANLPALVELIGRAVPTPLCIGAEDPKALDAALAVCPGKPVVYLIHQHTANWPEFLSIAQKRGAAVIVQALEPNGLPAPFEARVETARRILRESISKGVARDDVIVDPVITASAADETAAFVALRTATRVAQLDGINLTLRIQAAVTGLPHGETIAAQIIARALAAGVTCPIVASPAQLRSVLFADLLQGRPGVLKKILDTERGQ